MYSKYNKCGNLNGHFGYSGDLVLKFGKIVKEDISYMKR